MFRAHEPARGRLVAIKVFQLEILPEHAAVLVQALDALVGRGLGHPGISAPIAAGLDGNVAYLAQEYAVGESLDVVMRERGSMPLATAAPLIGRLASAIDFAARRGVHHGLLHPRDIILGEDGPRITGFGVAEALAGIGVRLPVRRPYAAPESENARGARGSTSSPRPELVDRSTLLTIDPELAERAEGRELPDLWGGGPANEMMRGATSPADVFALAAITWELIAGRRLAGDAADAVRAIGQLKTESGGNLGGLFANALSANPAARPSRARSFALGLRKAAGLEAPDLEEAETVRLKPDATVVGPDPTVRLKPDATRGPQRGSRVGVQYVGPVLPPSREALADRRSLGGGGSDRPLPDEAADAFAPSPAERLLEAETLERFAEVGAASDVLIDADPGAIVETVRLKPDATYPDTTYVEPVLPPSHEASADRRSLGGGGSDRPLPGAEEAPSQRRIGILAVVAVLAVGILVGFLAGYGLRSASPAGGSGEPPRRSTEQSRDKSEAPERALTPEPSRGSDPVAATEVALPPPVAAPPAAVALVPAPTPTPKAAPPPSPPPVTLGGLQVRTTPAGASVIVNGKLRGTTPLTLRELPLGSYTIRLTRDGYVDEERRLQLTAARANSSLAVTLKRAAAPITSGSGSLVVESRPSGAQVFLNSRLIGKTPLSMAGLPAGPATVRIERAGYQPWVSTVEVMPGQRTRVAASLETRR